MRKYHICIGLMAAFALYSCSICVDCDQYKYLNEVSKTEIDSFEYPSSKGKIQHLDIDKILADTLQTHLIFEVVPGCRTEARLEDVLALQRWVKNNNVLLYPYSLTYSMEWLEQFATSINQTVYVVSNIDFGSKVRAKRKRFFTRLTKTRKNTRHANLFVLENGVCELFWSDTSASSMEKVRPYLLAK